MIKKFDEDIKARDEGRRLQDLENIVGLLENTAFEEQKSWRCAQELDVDFATG